MAGPLKPLLLLNVVTIIATSSAATIPGYLINFLIFLTVTIILKINHKLLLTLTAQHLDHFLTRQLHYMSKNVHLNGLK